MVAVEGAATIPGDEDGQAETEWPEPVLPGAGAEPENRRTRSSWRSPEGNHYGRFFSIIPATGRAAMRGSYASGEVPCSAFARGRAGVL